LDVFDVSIDPFGRSGHHVEALEERVLDGTYSFESNPATDSSLTFWWKYSSSGVWCV